MTKKERIKELLSEIDDADLLYIHRNYCDLANYPDNVIYDMGEFDEIMAGFEPWEIAQKCFFGDFRPCDKYFWFDGYANLRSSDWLGDWIDTEDIAEFCDRNDEDLSDKRIREILDEEESEENDENDPD